MTVNTLRPENPEEFILAKIFLQRNKIEVAKSLLKQGKNDFWQAETLSIHPNLKKIGFFPFFSILNPFDTRMALGPTMKNRTLKHK